MKKDADNGRNAIQLAQGPAAQETKAIRILAEEAVLAWIGHYAKSDVGKELGGVLLGRRQRDVEDPALETVVICACLEARHTQALQGSITFTHETWNDIHSQKEEKYPELCILGWFHTHPNFGVFLSSYDLFIQENFFSLSWQIAYVVDPVRGEHGFFSWREGEVAPCGFALLSGSAREEIGAATQVPRRKRRNGFGAFALLCLAFLLVFLSYSYLQYANARNLAAYTAAQQAPVSRQEQQEMRQEAQRESVVYTVTANDTLEQISQRMYGTAAFAQRIAAFNHLSDQDWIRVGDKILIPLKEEKSEL